MLKLHPTRPASSAGFTFPEILVVIVVATILAAIATPSFLNVLSNRRATTVRDDIIQAMRETQRVATSRRAPQTLEIDTTVTPLPTLDIAGTGFRPVANGNVPGQGLTIMINGSENVVQEIVFDENGAVDTDSVALPLTVEVTINERGRRCAVLQSILGTIRAESGAACDG